MIEIELLNPVIKDDTPIYDGPVNVVPSTESQTLETAGKKLESDVTIAATPLESKTLDISDNGQYSVTPDEAVGLSEVEVNVDVQPELQTKSVEYTANVEQTIMADEGYYGLSAVNVKVDIRNEEADLKDVNFYDVDGRRLYSYTKSEFLELSSLPPVSVHETIVSEGWSWTLNEAKAYVNKYTNLNIGQTFRSVDGKTRIYITLNDGRLEPYLSICINGTANVDWGDGTNQNVQGHSLTSYVNIKHTYAKGGQYVISITPPAGEGETLRFRSDTQFCRLISAGGSDIKPSRVYLNSITKIEVGSGITRFPYYCFRYLYSIEYVAFSKNIEFDTQGYQFYGSSISYVSLSNIVNPVSGLFYQCNRLKVICLSPTTNLGQGMFRECLSLKAINFVETNVISGCCYQCYSMSQIIIPDTITTIASVAFQSCWGIGKIVFTSNVPPVVENANAFSDMTSYKIYVPQASLNAYKTATNYPNPNTYTYIGY